jgi:hypothetical protein
MKRIWFFMFLFIFLSACVPQVTVPQTELPQIAASQTKDLITETPQIEIPVTETPLTVLPPTITPEASGLPILRVAYSKNADPWIWTEGEGPRQVADSVNVTDVVLSSDGQVVAFKRDDTSELLAVNADGSGLRTLVSAEFLAGKNVLVWRFDFAPRSHTVYFTLVPSEGNFAPYYDLYRVDADAATPDPVQVRAPGQGGVAMFSPDGQWMTLYHAGGLDLVRTDGSEARTIFSYPEGYEPATFGPDIVWKQDSSGFSLFRINAAWFVPVAGGDPTLSPTIASQWGAVSPDGQRVAYTTNGNPSEVHIVEADGTDRLYTTVQDGSFGGWLPDSVHFTIIYEVVIEGFYGMANQYSIGALGEELVRLTDTEHAYPVVWLSNDRFLFGGLNELRIQSIGQPSVVLDENVYNIFDYAWIAR